MKEKWSWRGLGLFKIQFSISIFAFSKLKRGKIQG
jgi:hypothetical protein